MENNIDKKELKHDAVPGYRPVFITVFAGFTIYLLYIFLTTPWGAMGVHH